LKTMTSREIDAAYAAAVDLGHLLDRTLDKFQPLLFCRKRYLVLKGGGGSGKSHFAADKVLWRSIGEAGHRQLVVRKVGKDLRDSCFSLLRSHLGEHYPDLDVKVNVTNMTFTFPNGSEILLRGLDNVERLKSIHHITSVWIEEATELEERDLSQLDIRLRDPSPYYKQTIITFNPVSATHWLKARFFDKPDPRARISESTYLDNRFLPVESAEVLEHFRETDEYYYQVYCLGQWGVTGRTVFNARLISERLTSLSEPREVGYFENIPPEGQKPIDAKFVHLGAADGSGNGIIRIYKNPEEGKSYVIGADTAGTGSDWFVGQVIDAVTGEQVCTLRMQDGEEMFAAQLYCLGLMYNSALLAVEVNFSTYVVRKLREWGYPRQYVREVLDTFTGKMQMKHGWVTDSKTRPLAIAYLVESFRNDVSAICDRVTLEEMQTFVRNAEFRPEAEAGAHDDCVMALAIAYAARSQAPSPKIIVPGVEKAKDPWTKDMWDDYNAGSESERQMMIKMWGAPR